MKLVSACTRCFGSLSVKTRLGIISILQKNNSLSVTEIARHFNLTQPTITHHLKNLEKSGILASEKIGRKVFYKVKPKCSRKECHVFD